MRWRIERADDGPLAIAGIWEYWPADQLLSFSLLTINADSHPLIIDDFHGPVLLVVLHNDGLKFKQGKISRMPNAGDWFKRT